jgi:methylthioribose-1-phosphate isomerase
MMNEPHLQTVAWKHNAIRLIDQTRLPETLHYVDIRGLKTLWQAIKAMKVRGAPALGGTAALGVYLGIKNARVKNISGLMKIMDEVIAYIGSSRPTARNLFWAMERIRRAAQRSSAKTVEGIKQLTFKEAQKIIAEDMISCRNIGRFGQTLLKDNDTVLTICNTGILATIDYGTALGVIYSAVKQGKRIKVYACETRPMLQGARLTTWELKRAGIETALICDSMAASLMSQGLIQKVIAGADRIVANGDTANKIGTYNLAVASRYHNVPFYVAAPASTFDLRLRTGKEIPIEERPGDEVTKLFFKKPIAAAGIGVYNPAFDVTPGRLISAIITDRGIVKAPYTKNIRNIIKG